MAKKDAFHEERQRLLMTIYITRGTWFIIGMAAGILLGVFSHWWSL